MIVLRLIAFAVIVAIGVCLLAFVVKKDRRYLDFAFRLFKYTLILMSVFGLFYVLERLILVA
ncbi:MAG: hypothetical protein K2P57_03135 [Burkholderiales bacterium]|nr:hypothetical protein [Burkholderiales bacterium]